MKKLIMFVMVIVIAAPVSADLLVQYDFDGDVTDSSGNGYDGTKGTGVSWGDGTADFDGSADAWVEIPLGADNPCGGTQDFTIAMAYSCANTYWGIEQGNSVLFNIGSGVQGIGSDENQLGILTFNDGQYTDVWGFGADCTGQSGIGYADGDIHWFIFTYTGSTETRAWYGIDGGGSVVAISHGVDVPPDNFDCPPTWGYDVDYSTRTTTIGNGDGNGEEAWMNDMGFIPLDGEVDAFALYDHILTEEEMAGLAGYVLNPILIDANDVVVYEPVVPPPFDSEGNFTVRLRNEPEPGAPVTVVIDPNGGPGGGNPDLTLYDGAIPATDGPDPLDNRIHITFTDFTDLSDPNWDEPQVVRFVAVDDDIPEPEGESMSDPHTILVSSYYPTHPTDANYVGAKAVAVTVEDNDKANILFRVTGFRGLGV